MNKFSLTCKTSRTIRFTVLLLIVCCWATRAQPVDSLRLTIEKSDSLFISQNLLLLSKRFNISAQEALILQAKAYPNPFVSASLNLIDPEHHELFNIGVDGQKEFDIQQLIILGGKRQTSIQMARQNHDIAVLEFDDLLRHLRLELHSSFYTLYKYQTIIANYDHQMSLLDRIIGAYEVQAEKGNIPLKDVIRLKTIYLRISNEKLEVRTAMTLETNKMQVLFRDNRYPIPVVDESWFNSIMRVPPKDSLLSIALTKRPDLKAVQMERELASMNLAMQKKIVIPNAIVSAGYDQRGGAFKNQVNAGVALPVPIFDRNRGNIRAASYGQAEAELMIDQKLIAIESEIMLAWQNVESAIKEYSKAVRLYSKDFTDVFNGVNVNFSRSNLSILEFADFFEAYNESLTDFQRIRTQLALSAEQINYVTSVTIY